MAALINATENAIGYMILRDAIKSNMPIASVAEFSFLQGGPRLPTLESIEMGLLANGENFGNFGNDPERLMANLVGGDTSAFVTRRNYQGTEAWPIIAYAYLGVRKDTLASGSTCEGRRLGVYRFMEWLMTNQVAHRLMNVDYIVPPLSETRRIVLDRFYSQFKCQGTQIYGSPAWDAGRSAALQASLNLSPRLVRVKAGDDDERALVSSLARVYGKGSTGLVQVQAVDDSYAGKDALGLVLGNSTSSSTNQTVTIPLLRVAWGAVYNVPLLNGLVLTLELLRPIYDGTIALWTDSRLVDAQTDPALKQRLLELSGRPIEVIFYPSGSSSDLILRRFLGEQYVVKATPGPSRSPTVLPSSAPSFAPIITQLPTKAPTTTRPSKSPTTARPSKAPTTARPSIAPSTARPSAAPTVSGPTASPTQSPGGVPDTFAPSNAPTWAPSKAPTTARPSRSPTTARPSRSPTTSRPSTSPTLQTAGFSKIVPSTARARGYVSSKSFSIGIVPLLDLIESPTLNLAKIMDANGGNVAPFDSPSYPMALQYSLAAPAQFEASMCLDGTGEFNIAALLCGTTDD
jgi:ABC-type phosphate transport system substrate-binding protein